MQTSPLLRVLRLLAFALVPTTLAAVAACNAPVASRPAARMAPPHAVASAHAVGPARPVVLGYSTPRGDAYYPPAAYDYSVYTHLARAFLEPHADGSITAPDGFWNSDLERLAKEHGVKLLASLGGGSQDATRWLAMARDESARERFFRGIERLVSIHRYDGIDIDWEPSAHNAADERTFTGFMRALRVRFPNWILTTALGTGEWTAKYVDWPQVAASVDYINLMTYVYTGEWSGRSGHNANLYEAGVYRDPDALDVDTNVRAVIDKYGVRPGKLTLGLPFFGLQFSTTKLGDPFGEDPEYRGREIDYSDVALRLRSGQYSRHWDESAHVPYLERKRGGHTISYDDPRAIREKCAYALEHHLAGVMIWSVGADVVGGEPVLEQAVARAFQITPAKPPVALRRQYYRARRLEAHALSEQLDGATRRLVELDPSAAGDVGKRALPRMADEPATDPKLLERQTASVEARIVQLESALDAVDRRIEALPLAARRGRPIAPRGAALILGDFDEGLGKPLGGAWQTDFDHNGLGTTFHPLPLVPTADGARRALHVFGHLGKNQPPWPYASVLASFAKADLSAFGALRFKAKGNGKTYLVTLLREGVRDHANFRAAFEAKATWTTVEVPFSAFKQPDWGKHIRRGWYDVTGIAFSPGAQFSDEDFDFWLDDVELVPR